MSRRKGKAAAARNLAAKNSNSIGEMNGWKGFQRGRGALSAAWEHTLASAPCSGRDLFQLIGHRLDVCGRSLSQA